MVFWTPLPLPLPFVPLAAGAAPLPLLLPLPLLRRSPPSWGSRGARSGKSPIGVPPGRVTSQAQNLPWCALATRNSTSMPPQTFGFCGFSAKSSSRDT